MEKRMDSVKATWQDVVKIALPAVMESFFVAVAGIIDMIMVSSLGEYGVAAVGLTNQPKFFFFTVYFGISVAVSALVARRKGQSDQMSANETLVTALAISIAFCVVLSSTAILFAEPILIIAGSNSDTHVASTIYFRIIMGGMFFTVVSMVINAAQRGSGNTKIAFTTNFVSTIVNVCGNFLLITGRFGFPRLGIAGAALATVCGTSVAFVMSLISLFRKVSFVQVAFIIKNKIHASAKSAKSIFNLAINIVLENLAMRAGFVATAFMAARLGTFAFTTHQIGMNILSLGFAFADGMQVAAVALTGQALGSGNPDLAKRLGSLCQRIGFIISVVLAVFLFFAGKAIFMMHSNNDEIIKNGEMISRFIMVIVLAQISQIIFGGCLRAAGDVRYTLLASIVSVTIIRTVVTLLLTGYFKLGLVGIWCGILSDQVSRFIFMSTRYKQGKWVHIKI